MVLVTILKHHVQAYKADPAYGQFGSLVLNVSLSKVPRRPARLPARCFSEFTAGDVAVRMLGISGEEKGTDGFQ